MRAHYLQHVSFEGLGSMSPWLEQAGYHVTCTRLFEQEELPGLEGVDLLIVMGGPMSVNGEAEFPWLVREKQFIRRAIEADKPVLGVCLGAQLIACATGARVYPHSEKEIGWFPIEGVAAADAGAFRFPSTLPVFHWHGETFDPPRGSVHTARSECCENQAFQLGPSVIGMQFHLETTPDAAKALVMNCRHEMENSRYVQSESGILSAAAENYRAANALMAEVLAYLTARRR